MDSINDILSSLTPDDIETLKSMADSLFHSAQSTQENTPSCVNEENSGSFIPPDMLIKLSSVMNMMNSSGGGRYRLIEALKPNLSRQRRKKADEAMQILKLLEILPVIADINKSGDTDAQPKP